MRRGKAIIALVAFFAGLGATLAFAGPAGTAGLPIVFVVNRLNPVVSVNVRDVVDYYEKRKRQWPDGVPVRFIDRAPGTRERELFVHGVLKQSESDIELFWFTQRLRSGNSIPVQVTTDALVIELVKAFRGAIGYVSSSYALRDEDAKVVQIPGLAGE